MAILSVEPPGSHPFGMTAGTAAALIAYVGKIFSPLESLGMEIEISSPPWPASIGSGHLWKRRK